MYVETPNLAPNAAQEAGGNLATIANAQGAGGTGIFQPTGGTGILGWLSGIYKALTGTLTVSISGNPIIGSGTNVIGQVQTANFPPISWTTPNSAFDARNYANITLSVTVAPTSAWTPQWSPDGNTWFNMSGQDILGDSQISISTVYTGVIVFKGGGYFRLNGGASGTFFISAGL